MSAERRGKQYWIVGTLPALLFCVALILVVGCASYQNAPAYWQEPAQTDIPPSYSTPNANPVAPTYATTKLMLFGGEDHKIYLGCINCNKYATDSILNQYGDNGSKYASDSILNKYSDFGSRYSNYSPWNKYATEPPVIVDKDGNFYGRFTVNRYHLQRTKIPTIVQFLDSCEGLDAGEIYEQIHQ